MIQVPFCKFLSARMQVARARRITAPRGITLIEMMVSITLTLIIMGTVMTIFGMITGAVADNRAVMETVDRLKSVTARLQADLQGRTCSTLPWNRIESASGYFLYAEGGATDAKPDAGTTGNSWLQLPKDETTSALASEENRVLGDLDDILMMTCRSRGSPFVGRGPNGPIESYLAEIVWFVRPAEVDEAVKPLTLYRRVLLIVDPQQAQGGGSNKREFFERYDISARYDKSSGQMVPNTLADLTMPENRFAHSAKGSGIGSIDTGADSPLRPFPMSSERYGEDVMLTNMLAFDIKGFDPWGGFGGAASDEVAMVPGDFDYSSGAGARGVYVDIGGPGGGDYTGSPRAESTISPQSLGLRGLYDTWSYHYEHDGITQRGSKDRATDLLDGDGGGGVDDGSERETCAPYLRPLRGIEVMVRVYEQDSRQVQQVTVVGDFMP